MWTACAALLAFSAATGPAPARSFAFPAPLPAPTAARHRAMGLAEYRPVRLRPVASTLRQQEGAGQLIKVLDATVPALVP